MIFLLKLNHRCYSFSFHIPLLLLWVTAIAIKVPYLAPWLQVGLLVYFSLMIWRYTQDKRLMPLKTKEDALSYLVGFNISVVFSLLSFLIILILKTDEKN